MNISENCLKIIKHYEGCQLTPYYDSNNILTCGWGHTGEGVIECHSITQEQADEWLLQDIQIFVNMLNFHLNEKEIEQNQFDALISFLYNVGPGAKDIKDGLFSLKNGNPSTLWKDVLNEDYKNAAGQFLLWDKAGNKVLKGLQKRRKTESILFSSNIVELF